MELSEVNTKANAGLTTGVIGTALSGIQLLHGGWNWGGYNGRDAGGIVNAAATMMCGDSAPVSRYEMEMAMKLAAKDSEISLLKSEQNTEVKIADVYERLIKRINDNERAQSEWNAQQMVNNAHMSASVAANANSIFGLQRTCEQITKIVVPNNAICPGWGAVTITPAAPTADAGTATPAPATN